MNRKRNKKNNDAILKLYTKPHSIFGIVSFCLALIVIACIISSIIMSASYVSGTEMLGTSKEIILIGLIGWIGAMLNLAGFGMAIISEGAKDMNKLFAHIGLLLHTIGIIYHLYVVWFGFF